MATFLSFKKQKQKNNTDVTVKDCRANKIDASAVIREFIRKFRHTNPTQEVRSWSNRQSLGTQQRPNYG